MAMFRRRSAKVDLAMKRAELEALESEHAQANGGADPKLTIELRRLDLAEKKLNHRMVLEKQAIQSKSALRVLQTVSGKATPHDDDPMQTMMMAVFGQMLTQQMNRNPIAEFLQMRELMDDEGGDRDSGEGSGWVKDVLQGVGEAVKASGLIPQRQAEQPQPRYVEVPPHQLAAPLAQEEPEEPMPQGIPAPQQALNVLATANPHDAAVWLLQQPGFRQQLSTLVAIPDSDVLPRLRRIQRPGWNPIALGENVIANKTGYMPVVSWLLANPMVTLAIVAEARRMAEDVDPEELELMPELD